MPRPIFASGLLLGPPLATLATLATLAALATLATPAASTPAPVAPALGASALRARPLPAFRLLIASFV
ncbi:MAG TPA: hypothetical protein VMV44_07935 [Rectinemataceae bacterium]|nr:hypothetical protein [Rectinemataceae bacterium]